MKHQEGNQARLVIVTLVLGLSGTWAGVPDSVLATVRDPVTRPTKRQGESRTIG